MYYKNESRIKRQLQKIFTPRNGKFMLQLLDPKNGFQMKFQTEEHDTHASYANMASTARVNSPSAFQRYVIFWGKFSHFKNYWAVCVCVCGGGGGGGIIPSISAFYSVRLCIIETSIHNTLLHRGSCDLTSIFLFQMFGNCDNAFASLTSFSVYRFCY